MRVAFHTENIIPRIVTGAPYEEIDSEVATALKTQSQSKDKDKYNKRIKQ